MDSYITSDSTPPPTLPHSPSQTSKLLRRSSRFCAGESPDDCADENPEEEENERGMWSRLLRQQQQQPQPPPPTERVLRPRRHVAAKKRKEEAANKAGEKKATMMKRRGKPKPKPKPAVRVALALTKEEIADDFVAFTGSKPPRWPKLRRNSDLQMRLNKLFPGICLQRTITGETYGLRRRSRSNI